MAETKETSSDGIRHQTVKWLRPQSTNVRYRSCPKCITSAATLCHWLLTFSSPCSHRTGTGSIDLHSPQVATTISTSLRVTVGSICYHNLLVTVVPFSCIMKFISYFDDKEVLEMEEDSVFLPKEYQSLSPADWLALPESQEVNVAAIYEGIPYNATILQVRNVKL